MREKKKVKSKGDRENECGMSNDDCHCMLNQFFFKFMSFINLKNKTDFINK